MGEESGRLRVLMGNKDADGPIENRNVAASAGRGLRRIYTDSALELLPCAVCSPHSLSALYRLLARKLVRRKLGRRVSFRRRAMMLLTWHPSMRHG